MANLATPSISKNDPYFVINHPIFNIYIIPSAPSPFAFTPPPPPHQNYHIKKVYKKSLTGGFEPPTFRLTAERSAD